SNRRLESPAFLFRHARDPRGLSADILKVLAGFEADCASWRDPDFLASSGIAPDTALARLDLKDTKPAKLDSFASLHGGAHLIEDSIDGHLSFDFGDVGDFRYLVDDVDLDHA